MAPTISLTVWLSHGGGGFQVDTKSYQLPAQLGDLFFANQQLGHTPSFSLDYMIRTAVRTPGNDLLSLYSAVQKIIFDEAKKSIMKAANANTTGWQQSCVS